MSLALLSLLVMGALAAGYLLYGRLIASRMKLDDSVRTPAEEVNDGEDFVPTKPFYLLGQHFSAIAAAGPIVGPILACLQFGWAPCLLWIGLGVIFIGAVHDFTALVASIRHKARSIAEIVREHLGPRAWWAIMAFIWIALVYVVIAFADVTAQTFVGTSVELQGLDAPFNKGGAVASAATMYLLLAVVMGLVQRFLRPPLWLITAVFVPATLGVVWVGTQIDTWLILPHRAWTVIIMAYCFAASLLPVWILLQPRGYLGGFVLYLALAIGVLGIFFGGDPIRQPAFADRPLAGLDKSIFPFLFVTIACGACSGFHGLVCSGTTSKQIARESHCRPVGFGGMLLEGFVALIALSTVMIVAPQDLNKRDPGTLYGDGLAHFLTAIVGAGVFKFAATFGTMAFSTFVFDTLDVATRLGRYIVQELFSLKGRRGAAIATALTAGVPLAILMGTEAGAFKTFWVLFGTSNQLLAALTLLGVTVWLKRTGRPVWFTVIPMAFVMTITIWALGAQVWSFFKAAGAGGKIAVPLSNGIVGSLLLLLTALLMVESLRALRRPAAGSA